jgi:hypothetical protein
MGLAASVALVSPLDGAIDGSLQVVPPKPAPPVKRRPAKGPDGTYKGWACPRCGVEFSAENAPRHLIAEMNGLTEELGELKLRGLRSEQDELGNVLVHGPDDDGRPAVWLQFGHMIVDTSIQREQRSSHRLLKPGAVLDLDKTEALTVVPVHERVKGTGSGEDQYRLTGYRVVEGQHRALLGQRVAPETHQLCKVIHVETRQDETRIGSAISHSRAGFAALDDWFALLRAGDPNVLAATKTLDSMGYLVSVNNSRTSIAAATVLMKISGIRNPKEMPVKAVKSPADGAADLRDVLYVLEGIKVADGEGNRRFRSTLLIVANEMIRANQDIIDLAKFRKSLGTRSAEEWLDFYKPALGGRTNIRAYMALAYNKGLSQKNKIR